MSLSSSTTVAAQAPGPSASASHASHAAHHHVAHGYHTRGGKRRMSSTALHAHGHGLGHGLHRTRSHASTTGMSEHGGAAAASGGGHALQRTSSHGGGSRANALAALQGMTAAPAMARQRSGGSTRSGSSENVRNAAAGKGKKRGMSRIENHRSASSGTIARLAHAQGAAASTAMHRSQTEPVAPATTKDADEEWESGDEVSDGADEDGHEAADDDGDDDHDDGALQMTVGKKGSRAGSRAGSKPGSRAQSKVGSRERKEATEPVAPPAPAPMPSASVGRRDDPETGLPPESEPHPQPLKRTSTIGFDIVGMPERGASEAVAGGQRVRSDSSDAAAPAPSSPPRMRPGTALGEPSLEKADRTQFIISPEKDAQGKATATLCPSPGALSGTTLRDDSGSHLVGSGPDVDARSSVPFPDAPAETPGSTDTAPPLPKQPSAPALRTRTSHTSLRSLQSFRAPPHPLSSPSSAHPRSRVSSGAPRRGETGMAAPVVNRETVQGSRAGSMEGVDQLGDIDASASAAGRRGANGLPRSASSRSGFAPPALERHGSAADVFFRKASFSSVRDMLPGGSSAGSGSGGAGTGTGTHTPGTMSGTGRLSAREATQAAARIASRSGPSAGGAGGGSGGGGSTGTLGRLASAAVGGSGAHGARHHGHRPGEYDQSHLVSRFVADKPKPKARRHAHGHREASTPRSESATTTPPTEDERGTASAFPHGIFPETTFSRAHASLVLSMRREKQTLHALQSAGVLSRTPSSAGLSRLGPGGAGGGGSVSGGSIGPGPGTGAGGQDARSLPVPAGLSPLELSMQRVLAQRAVAVSTSGLAGLGIEG